MNMEIHIMSPFYNKGRLYPSPPLVDTNFDLVGGQWSLFLICLLLHIGGC
jgi:hypothetical protein